MKKLIHCQMFSKTEVLKLIKLTVYQNVVLLIYSFINPHFTVTNFYYFSFPLLVHHIFDLRLRKKSLEEVTRDYKAGRNFYVEDWYRIAKIDGRMNLPKFFYCICFIFYGLSAYTLDGDISFRGFIEFAMPILGVIVFCYLIMRPMFLEELPSYEELWATLENEHKKIEIPENSGFSIESVSEQIIECINCDFIIDNPSTNLCPNCGSHLYIKSEYMSCESCGGEYDNSATSCLYCGHIPSL